MPRDGSGNYSLPAGYLAVNGQTILPSQHNPPLEDIASALTGSLPRNGSAPMTGNLPMGTNKITGLGVATTGTDALSQDAGDARYPLVALTRLTGNLLINGGFNVWHRHSASAPVVTGGGANPYVWDRWWCIASVSTASIVPSTGGVHENGYPGIFQTNTSLFPSRHGIAQALEQYDVQPLRGQQVTFAYRGIAAATATIRVAILSWAGTADTINRSIVNNWSSTNYTAGNFFAAGWVVVGMTALSFPAATATTVSCSGTVPTGANNLVAFVWTENNIAVNDILKHVAASLERGPVANVAFKTIFAEEAAKCERFFARYPLRVLGTATAASQVFSMSLKYEMRRVPTSSLTGASYVNCTGPFFDLVDRDGARWWILSVASGQVSGDGIMYLDAEL